MSRLKTEQFMRLAKIRQYEKEQITKHCQNRKNTLFQRGLSDWLWNQPEWYWQMTDLIKILPL